jgi:hypothetical protein
MTYNNEKFISQEQKNMINYNVSKGLANALLRDGLISENEFNNLIQKLKITYDIAENESLNVKSPSHLPT